MSLFDQPSTEPVREGDVLVYPWTLDRAVTVFLNRWAFNWRGERAVIEKELRQLIAAAKEQG